MRYVAIACLAMFVAPAADAATSLPKGPKPAWVEGDGADFPAAQFFTGVGMAVVQGTPEQSIGKAETQARVDLAKKLEVSVSSEFNSYQRETQKNGLTTSVQSVEEVSREAVRNMDLEGVEVKARWYDSAAGVVYALAVWPKARAEALLRAKVDEEEAKARSAESQGDQSASANPAVALRQYLEARAVLEAAQQSAVLLRAVTSRPAQVPSVASVRGKLDGLLDKISVAVAGGDGQRVKPNQSAARPLEVKASLGGAPLAGVSFRFELPGGQVTPSAVTDAAGVARGSITNAGPIGAEAQVTASVDWSAGREPAAWLRTLRPLEVRFKLVAEALGSTRVLIVILESIKDGPAVDTGGLRSSLSNAFTAQGFTVQDGAALVQRLGRDQLVTADPETMRSNAQELADVAVIGEAVAEYSSTLSGEVVTHRARLNLRAVDLRNGRVVGTLSLEKKGRPGKGAEKAGKNALDALAQGMDAAFAAEVKRAMAL